MHRYAWWEIDVIAILIHRFTCICLKSCDSTKGEDRKKQCSLIIWYIPDIMLVTLHTGEVLEGETYLPLSLPSLLPNSKQRSSIGLVFCASSLHDSWMVSFCYGFKCHFYPEGSHIYITWSLPHLYHQPRSLPTSLCAHIQMPTGHLCLVS